MHKNKSIKNDEILSNLNLEAIVNFELIFKLKYKYNLKMSSKLTFKFKSIDDFFSSALQRLSFNRIKMFVSSKFHSPLFIYLIPNYQKYKMKT